jgi:cell division septation protein DedD
MKRTKKLLVILLAAGFMCAVGTVAADALEEGFDAYQSGDYATAIQRWQPLALEGNARARFFMSIMYEKGQGVGKSTNMSLHWLKLSAEQGFPPAQFNLGNSYMTGEGVRKDPREAAKWWRKAADQGYGLAQYNLGSLYYHGHGVDKNEEEAIRWYRLAAAQGLERASRTLESIGGGGNGGASGGDEITGQAAPAAQVNHQRSRATEAEVPPTDTTPTAGKTPRAERGAQTARKAVPQSSPATDDEAWIAEQPGGNYTVQLLATNKRSFAEEFVSGLSLDGRLAVFGFRRNGADWFAVLFESYPDRESARRSVAALPERLRRNKPWIRRFHEVQVLMADAR